MNDKKTLNGWGFISMSLGASFNGPTAYFEVGIPTEYSRIPEKLKEMADRGVPVPPDIIERAIRERAEAKASSLRQLAHDRSDEQSLR